MRELVKKVKGKKELRSEMDEVKRRHKRSGVSFKDQTNEGVTQLQLHAHTAHCTPHQCKAPVRLKQGEEREKSHLQASQIIGIGI